MEIFMRRTLLMFDKLHLSVKYRKTLFIHNKRTPADLTLARQQAFVFYGNTIGIENRDGLCFKEIF